MFLFPLHRTNVPIYQLSCSKLCSLTLASMQCTDHDGVSGGDHRVSGGDELVTTSSPVPTGSGRRGRRRDRGRSRLWWWRPLWSDCVHSQTHTTSLLTVVYTKNLSCVLQFTQLCFLHKVCARPGCSTAMLLRQTHKTRTKENLYIACSVSPFGT